MVCMEHDVEGEGECHDKRGVPQEELEECAHHSEQHSHIRAK